MKLTMALGVALAGLTVAGASAHSTSRHVVISHHGGGDLNLDADEDGWITRAEASSAYERVFADLDTNDDGKLDDTDRRRIHIRGEAPEAHVFHHSGDREVRVLRGGGDREMRVITGDMDEETRAEIEREIDEAMSRAEVEIERAERQAERAEELSERDAERAEERAERAAEHAERRVHRLRSDDNKRHVIIVRTNGEGGAWASLDGDVVAPVAPVPPVPPIPHAAPFMLLIANSEEADRNGDGALSRDEFVAQHLRFFDASDANGDGRVRFEEAPAPPEPPTPPAPPEPPRRR